MLHHEGGRSCGGSRLKAIGRNNSHSGLMPVAVARRGEEALPEYLSELRALDHRYRSFDDPEPIGTVGPQSDPNGAVLEPLRVPPKLDLDPRLERLRCKYRAAQPHCCWGSGCGIGTARQP